MSFTPEQIRDLSGPLSSTHVKERTQAGRKLSYIESWRAISEANRIFGFDGWHSTTRLKKLFDAYKDGKDLWRVGYMAKVTVAVKDDGQYVTRDGVGYGSGIDRDLGQAHESAIKEAESDARKRALMTFGNPFGLALYDKEQANVSDDEPAGTTQQHVAKVAANLSKEPNAPKAPGITEARKWVSEFLKDANACSDGDQLLVLLASVAERWTRICSVYPDLWEGPDGSGLRGETQKVATMLECRSGFDTFVKSIIKSATTPAQEAAE